MLKEKLFINNQDAYENYGLYIKDYTPLIPYPPYKSIKTNDWHEQDGVEADLSCPVLSGRSITLQFYTGRPDGVSEAQVFLSDLLSKVYHTFYFPKIGKTYKFRLVSGPSFNQNKRFDKFSLTFAEDNIAIPTEVVPFVATGIPLGYTIDDADFAQYGCTVLQGTRDSLLKFSQPKEALQNNSNQLSGVIYDSNDIVRLRSKDITIKLHIRTKTISEFWQKWDSLWSSVFAVNTEEGLNAAVRVIEGDGMTFRCYYKKNAVDRFLFTPEGGVWCDFSITFAVLSYNRGDEWYYLAMEDDSPVLFEDGDETDENSTLVRIR